MIPNPFNTNNQDPIYETFQTQSDSESDNDTNLQNKGNIVIKSQNKQKGLIGEGTFGCIYDDLDNPDKVHKIFLYKSQYKEELDVAIMLYNSFKNNNISLPKGLLLPDNINNPSLPNEIDKEYLTKRGYKVCKLLADKKYKKSANKSYKYLTYTHGGSALNNCLDEFNTIFDLLVALDNIFDAISSLENVHISHHDIKMPNLLYNKDNQQTILIDYGITYKYTDLFAMNPTNNKNWPISYFVWPPEFHAIWYIMKYKYVPTARIMIDIVKSVVDLNELYVPRFKHMYNSNDLTDFTEFRQELNKSLDLDETLERTVSLNNINNNELSTYFANNFAKKSDVYGLAMLLYAFNKHVDFISENAMELNLSKYLNINPNKLTDEQHIFCKDIQNMIKKMASPNPYKRYSAIECNLDYTKYIRKILYKFKNGNTNTNTDTDTNIIKNKNVFGNDTIDNIEDFTDSNAIIAASYIGAVPTSPFAIFITIILFLTICILGSIYLDKLS